MGKVLEESENKEYWEEVCKHYTSIREASRELNLDRETVKKYMNKFNLSFSPIVEKYNLEEMKNCIISCGGIKLAAQTLGVKPEAIKNKIYSSGTSLTEIMYEYQQKIAPIQKQAEMMTGDCVITADYHCPFVSIKWVDRVVEVGKREKIKQLLIAGDFFDFDRLSWWLKAANAEDMAVPLDDELNLASMVLEKLEKQYSTIYFMGGNHWLRLLKNITFSVPSKKLLGLVNRANDSKYKINEYFDWILIDDKVRVTHPGKARRSDYTLSRDLSYIHPNQWLVVAHRHRVNDGFTPSGNPMLEIGWLGDTERMRYIQHTDSTYYNWVNGFCYYKNGILRNLTEFNTDWSEIDKIQKE